MYAAPHETIVALASALGPGARGVVRLSGDDVAACLLQCVRLQSVDETPSLAPSLQQFVDLAGAARRTSVLVQCESLDIPAELLYWPDARSYTRQPAAELHAAASAPLLAAIVEALVRCGARLAQPGEFTLRAFLAGRIDLTQAEAVLGVVDAHDERDLAMALAQLAGGLALPLAALRESLLMLLAEVEAQLDFAEEDLQFIAAAELRSRLTDARGAVAATLEQLESRGVAGARPLVALVGPPNAGKSSLFNALSREYGTATDAARAIVSPQPHATRDYLIASVTLGGVDCDLADTAGRSEVQNDEIASAAQHSTHRLRDEANLLLECRDASAVSAPPPLTSSLLLAEETRFLSIALLTKSDAAPHSTRSAFFNPSDGQLYCSARTGEGLAELAAAVAAELRSLRHQPHRGEVVAATANRCRASLQAAFAALDAAINLIGTDQGELLAAELRSALDALGDVAGVASADDVLDRVFRQFCIGK